MRAWRGDRGGGPLEGVELGGAPIPEPGPGGGRGRGQASPLNLHDLERITRGHMRVAPACPCSPRLEGTGAGQLARHAGARVFATAGTDEKVQLCRDLGADVAINYTTDDFAEVVLAETGKAGVDVVFDNVGEAVMEKSMNCIAYNGRYLMMGFASNKVEADEKVLVPRRILLGNVQVSGGLLN